MNATDPTSAREEAERLVAAAIAAMSSAAPSRGFGAWGALGSLGDSFFGAAHGRIATGDPECCVCPVCRVIAAMRDPSPEFAERVATGAGDFAAGVASLLRSLSEAVPAGTRPSESGPSESGQSEARPSEARPQDEGEDVWRAATRAGHDSGPMG